MFILMLFFFSIHFILYTVLSLINAPPLINAPYQYQMYFPMLGHLNNPLYLKNAMPPGRLFETIRYTR